MGMNVNLTPYLDELVRSKVSSGMYTSASEVVRDALRHMEERNSKLEALRRHLAEGERQAMNENFIQDFSMEQLIAELDQE